MPIKKARNHFLGTEGCPKFNCAQSVLMAFGVNEKTILDFQSHGSGRAPGGWCGAASSAVFLLNDNKTVEKYFYEKAGSVTCKEIRKLKQLSCIGCVELATELVQNKLPNIKLHETL